MAPTPHHPTGNPKTAAHRMSLQRYPAWARAWTPLSLLGLITACDGSPHPSEETGDTDGDTLSATGVDTSTGTDTEIDTDTEVDTDLNSDTVFVSQICRDLGWTDPSPSPPPLNPNGLLDMDDDGVWDTLEVALGLDPSTADTDADGIRDSWELLGATHALDPIQTEQPV